MPCTVAVSVPANFPQGVTYLRNHNFTTRRLLALNGTTEVPVSIDPFFFSHSERAITRLTRLTRFTRFTPLTQLTRLTRLTELTRLTRLTRLTQLTPLTRLTLLTRFTPFTIFEGVEPPFEEVTPGAEPFIRFGNTIFAPEDLDLARFEELTGALEELAAAGITRLQQLVTAEPHLLVSALGYSREDAGRLIELAQLLMRNLVR